MNRIIRWQRTGLAIITAGVLISSSGVAHARDDRASVAAPRSFAAASA